MSGLHIKRAMVAMALIAYLSSCTHLPSGEKAFDNFESCFGANLGLAVAGGTAVGVLSAHLADRILPNVGSASAKKIGTTAGVAAAAMIAMTAWRKCAAVYNTSEPVGKPVQVKPAQGGAKDRRHAGMTLDRLEVKLTGTENDPPAPEFDFTYLSEDPSAKDIKAKLRHKLEIVKFKAGDDDKLILADAKGDPLLDGAGKTIPLEAAIKMRREQLHWVTIAEEGKDEYVEDVIIQQSQRTSYRHKLQIPPRAQLPLPLPVPMRYTLTVEADNMRSTRTVDFALLGTKDRPRQYSASAPVDARDNGTGAGTAPPPVATRALKPAASFAATHVTSRNVALLSEAGTRRKPIASLAKGALVRVDARTEVKAGQATVPWVKVVAESGATGWLPAREIAEIKP